MSTSSAGTRGRRMPVYGPGGRTIGSATYAYNRFRRAQLFGQVASTWRLEQRIESDAGELLRLERKRAGDRRRRVSVGDVSAKDAVQRGLRGRRQASRKRRRPRGAVRRRSDPPGSHPRRRRSRTERSATRRRGCRSISVQDGVRMIDVDRLPQGHGRRSLALGLGCGRIGLSIVSIMDDVGTAGAGGDRADRRTAGTGGRSSDRRRRRNHVGSRGRRAPTSRFAAIRRVLSRPARCGVRGPRCACRSRASAAVLARCRYICAASRHRGSSTASGRQAASMGWDRRSFCPRAPKCRATSRSFRSLPVRIRTGVGVPLKSLGPVSRGEARFYMTAGTSF